MLPVSMPVPVAVPVSGATVAVVVSTATVAVVVSVWAAASPASTGRRSERRMLCVLGDTNRGDLGW